MSEVLINNCFADTILNFCVIDDKGDQKKLTLLIDSSNDWSGLTGTDELKKQLGFFGSAILRAILPDPTAVAFQTQSYLIVMGQYVDFTTPKPYFRDGKRFRRGNIDSEGNITFLPEDEI